MKRWGIMKLSCLLLAFVMVLLSVGCAEIAEIAGAAEEIYGELEKEQASGQMPEETAGTAEEMPELDEYGAYTSRDDVALYIHIYGHLPENFVTKSEAKAKGWEGGSVEKYFPGCCIGGDVFGNYEGLLPEKSGRTYTECDIDTLGEASRGAKRIVFSNDGLVYYTDDHYESFTLLYGEE